MENVVLYRKVSLKEVVDIQKRLFVVPETRIFDTRKWFTNSLLGAARFQNPYVDLSKDDQVLLRIGVDPSFFDDEKIKMTLLKNERYKFYRNNSIKDAVIVCPTHLVTSAYSSFGIRGDVLPYFNDRVDSIDIFHMDEACSMYLKEQFGVTSVDDLMAPSLESTNAYFFIALPYDLALALKRENLIYSEGFKGGKKRYISKDLETLKKADTTSSCIMLVELKDTPLSEALMYNLEQKGIMDINISDIFKLNEIIQSANFVEYDKSKDFHQSYIGVGSNARVIHEPHELSYIPKVGPEDYEEFNRLLVSGDFEDAIEKVYPILEKMKGCNQLEPKHIDDVYDHAIKSAKALDKVIETLSFVCPISDKEKALMKLSLLFHDVGKPFMFLKEKVDRYTQFAGHFNQKGSTVIVSTFENIPDLPILLVLSSLSGVNGRRKYHVFFEAIKTAVPDDAIEKGIWLMFLMRTAHIMSLKPQKFCAYYSELILMLEEYLKYNRRTWRREVGPIITSDLISHLRGFESYLQPDVTKEEVYIKEDVKPLLMSIMENIPEEKYSEDYQAKKALYDEMPEQMELQTAMWALKSSFAYPLLEKEIGVLDLDMIVKSKVHGVYHNEKVAFLSSLIALMKGLNEHDTWILILAALYHDCGRENDFDETRHGLLGALKFEERFASSLSLEDMHLLKFMIEAHAIADSSFEELLKKYAVPEEQKERYLFMASILKDADGLDRVRISSDLPYSKLNPNYLRNGESLRLIKVAHTLNECFMKQIVYEGENIPRRLYRK